jgi:hypothetical protein
MLRELTAADADAFDSAAAAPSSAVQSPGLPKLQTAADPCSSCCAARPAGKETSPSCGAGHGPRVPEGVAD